MNKTAGICLPISIYTLFINAKSFFIKTFQFKKHLKHDTLYLFGQKEF